MADTTEPTRGTADELGRRRGGERGFAVIEGVIAVLIAGILSLIVILAAHGIAGREADRCAEERRALASSEEAALADGGRYLDEPSLVARGYAVEHSQVFDVRLGGDAYAIVPAAGSPC